jgi:hypothetical protein
MAFAFQRFDASIQVLNIIPYGAQFRRDLSEHSGCAIHRVSGLDE